MCSGRPVFVALLLALISLVAGAPLHAQGNTNAIGTGGIHEIRGRVFLPNGRSPSEPIRIELESYDAATLSMFTDRSGGFAFVSLAPGNYAVTIKESDLFETAREAVTIDTDVRLIPGLRPTPKIFNVPLHLRTKATIARKAAVLNAKLAVMPKPAADLYERAQRSISEGKDDQAIVELRQAIAAYNPFSLAWNDLGVLLEKKGDNKGALDAFKNAVRYDNTSTAAILNLGCALTNNKAYEEAEKYLAVALEKDGALYRGHYYMGLTQAKLGRLDIAEQAFLKAIELGGNRAAKAHYLLAGVYWATLDYKRAADHLELYLKLDPSAKDAIKTRESISELRKKQKGPTQAIPNPFS